MPMLEEKKLIKKLKEDLPLFCLNDPATTKYYVSIIEFLIANFPYFSDLELVSRYFCSENRKFNMKFLSKIHKFYKIAQYKTDEYHIHNFLKEKVDFDCQGSVIHQGYDLAFTNKKEDSSYEENINKQEEHGKNNYKLNQKTSNSRQRLDKVDRPLVIDQRIETVVKNKKMLCDSSSEDIDLINCKYENELATKSKVFQENLGFLGEINEDSLNKNLMENFSTDSSEEFFQTLSNSSESEIVENSAFEYEKNKVNLNISATQVDTNTGQTVDEIEDDASEITSETLAFDLGINPYTLLNSEINYFNNGSIPNSLNYNSDDDISSGARKNLLHSNEFFDSRDLIEKIDQMRINHTNTSKEKEKVIKINNINVIYREEDFKVNNTEDVLHHFRKVLLHHIDDYQIDQYLIDNLLKSIQFTSISRLVLEFVEKVNCLAFINNSQHFDKIFTNLSTVEQIIIKKDLNDMTSFVAVNKVDNKVHAIPLVKDEIALFIKNNAHELKSSSMNNNISDIQFPMPLENIIYTNDAYTIFKKKVLSFQTNLIKKFFSDAVKNGYLEISELIKSFNDSSLQNYGYSVEVTEDDNFFINDKKIRFSCDDIEDYANEQGFDESVDLKNNLDTSDGSLDIYESDDCIGNEYEIDKVDFRDRNEDEKNTSLNNEDKDKREEFLYKNAKNRSCNNRKLISAEDCVKPNNKVLSNLLKDENTFKDVPQAIQNSTSSGIFSVKPQKLLFPTIFSILHEIVVENAKKDISYELPEIKISVLNRFSLQYIRLISFNLKYSELFLKFIIDLFFNIPNTTHLLYSISTILLKTEDQILARLGFFEKLREHVFYYTHHIFNTNNNVDSLFSFLIKIYVKFRSFLKKEYLDMIKSNKVTLVSNLEHINSSWISAHLFFEYFIRLEKFSYRKDELDLLAEYDGFPRYIIDNFLSDIPISSLFEEP